MRESEREVEEREGWKLQAREEDDEVCQGLTKMMESTMDTDKQWKDAIGQTKVTQVISQMKGWLSRKKKSQWLPKLA